MLNGKPFGEEQGTKWCWYRETAKQKSYTSGALGQNSERNFFKKQWYKQCSLSKEFALCSCPALFCSLQLHTSPLASTELPASDPWHCRDGTTHFPEKKRLCLERCLSDRDALLAHISKSQTLEATKTVSSFIFREREDSEVHNSNGYTH